MALFATLLLCVSVAALPGQRPEHYREELSALIKQSQAIDPEFDCAWRAYALEYAAQLQGTLTAAQTTQLHDALQLTSLCKLPQPSPSPMKHHRIATAATIEIYVAPSGSDSNSGTIDSPVASILQAVLLVRLQRSKYIPSQLSTAPAAIWLREGGYAVNASLVLTSQDNFLTISGYMDETAVVSGGRIVNVDWKPTGSTNQYQAVLPSDVDAVPAMQINGQRATLARYPNANPELDVFPTGYVTSSTHWLPPEYKGQVCDSKSFCGPSYNLTIPVTDAWHGMFQNFTLGIGGGCDVYSPPQSPWCSGDFARSPSIYHARHPAGMSTNDLSHTYSRPNEAVVHAWRNAHWFSLMFKVGAFENGTRSDNWTLYEDLDNVYGRASSKKDTNQVKYLGTFDNLTACWQACNNSLITKKLPCTRFTYHHLDVGYADWAGGCYMTVDGVWAPRAQANVTSALGPHTDGGFFRFSDGGNQGAEGADTVAEWFVEGLQEELDAPNEYYFDNQSKVLSFNYNGSGSPPSLIVIPTEAQIFTLQGSVDDPATNITLQKMTITATRPTFFEPRTNPSGGDWSLERIAAIFMEGTVGCTVQFCNLTRLDSNAILLSGYNRYATIQNNNFEWLGQSAIALWGFVDGNDGTNGDQPRHTLVASNFMRELGLLQKQSSCYFHAIAAQSTIVNNICFNIPRAGINFNDGFGGGHVMATNLLFNTCRESSDHGAFNSWSRLPYFSDVRDGHTRSSIPAVNDVHHNFIVTNYAANGGCLDNDDGSSYYDIHHNFCVLGGHKSDFDGHQKRSFNNLHVYPSVYGTSCMKIAAQNLPPAGYAEAYFNNTCILPTANSTYLSIANIDGGNCLAPDTQPTFKAGLDLGGNTIFAPSALAVVECGGKSVTVDEFVKLGYDDQTAVSGNMPNASTIVAWAKMLLV